MAKFEDSLRSEDEMQLMHDLISTSARKGLPVAPEDMEQLDEAEISNAKIKAQEVIAKFVEYFSAYVRPVINDNMSLMYGITEKVITFKYTNLIDTMLTYFSVTEDQRRLLNVINNDQAAYPAFKKLVSGLIKIDFAYDEGGNEVFVHMPITKFKVIAESLDTQILSLIISMSLKKNMIKSDYGKSISEIVNEFMINEIYPTMGIQNQERYQKFAGLRKERGKKTKQAPKLGATIRSSRPKVVTEDQTTIEVPSQSSTSSGFIKTVMVNMKGKTITINSDTEIGNVVINLIGDKMTITI